jgi:cellulase/cellobiase CelA1
MDSRRTRLRLGAALLAAGTVFAVGVPAQAIAAAAVPPSVVEPSPTASPGPASCTVTYVIQAEWAGGFIVALTITNTGPVPVRWRVSWRYLPGQAVVQAWGGTFTQVGDLVTITGGAGWSEILQPGQSISIGFVGRYRDRNPVPIVVCVPA